ncbi:MAG: TRAM domain-containing protein [Actinomycetota bacterium]|nr:TRAM domain-containing protein [Actinomycetota bacterium]
MSEPRTRKPVPRGRLVEFVRFIFVVLFAIGGYEVATNVGSQATGNTVLGIVLGSATGYVAGGVFGRQTATAVSAVEQEFRRASAAEIAAGVAGLMVGLVISLLLSIPLFKLPAAAAWPAVVFVYLTFPYLGYRIGRAKREELFSLIGLKPRAAGVGRSEVSVMDTSALIDGRILELVRTGFVSGVLLVPQGVLGELQRIADSSDPRRRTRGRRGLDVVAQLQHDPTVEVLLVEEEAMGDVDAGLVRLARDRGGAVVTADANLAKVAEALSVPVRSINALAAGFRVPFLPGEELSVHLTREGREHGQGVGHLDDGTMVVVEGARQLVGSDVAVTVTNVLQTTTGRMVFATLTDQRSDQAGAANTAEDGEQPASGLGSA